MSSNVTDNNQVDGKSSVTAYAQTQGNKVLIVANGNSSPSDLSNPYMSVSVNVGESFVLTKVPKNGRLIRISISWTALDQMCFSWLGSIPRAARL